MKEQVLAAPSIQVKAYSKTEIAELYKLSMKSITKWLAQIEKELGPRIGRFYSPKQVEIIFKEYGIPKVMHDN